MKIGAVLQAQGSLPAALDSHRASLGIAERLANADPSNADWLRMLSIAHSKIGSVLETRGTLSAALDNYRAAHDAFGRLANAAPGNGQRDLGLSHGRIATVLARQGLQNEATAAFGRGHTMITGLLRQFPDSSVFSSDLAWFEDQLADLKQ